MSRGRAGLARHARSSSAVAEALLPRAAMLVAGLVAGVSFIAQPLKFRAQDVPLAQLVSAGSAIFHGAHALQLLVLPLLLAAALRWRAHDGAAPALLAAASAALLLQLALMPAFDARVAALAAGQTLPPAPWLHVAYGALELAKLAALLAAGLRGCRVDDPAAPRAHPAGLPI